MGDEKFSEIVERVAHALYAKDWEVQTGGFRDRHFAFTRPVGRLYEPEDIKAYWRGQARAAMESMREPTEAMLAAANDIDRGAGDPFVPPELDESWPVMIDAALKE